jgi:hypothetical protein
LIVIVAEDVESLRFPPADRSCAILEALAGIHVGEFGGRCAVREKRRQIAETRMMARAVRENWPTALEKRPAVIDALIETAHNGSARESIIACEALLSTIDHQTDALRRYLEDGVTLED